MKPPVSPDPARVRELLDQYGADPERFPETEREGAKRLLRTDPALQAQQQEAIALDALLASVEPSEPSADLLRRVAEIPLRHPRQDGREAVAPVGLTRWLDLKLSFWRFAGLSLAATLLGVGSGLWLEAPPLNSEQAFSEQVFADNDELDENWETLAALTFSADLPLDPQDLDLEDAP